MAEPRIAIAVLAAGSSRRFGARDKLAQPFRGALLGEHVVRAAPREAFSNAWVITSQPQHRCEPAWREAGFDMAINPEASRGMSTSVALAGQRAQQAGCDAVLIALADMPLVPACHFENLLAQFGKGVPIAVSCAGAARLPPAIFGAPFFDALQQSQGDQGARGLISQGEIVPCPADWLIDIDTPDALEEAERGRIA